MPQLDCWGSDFGSDDNVLTDIDSEGESYELLDIVDHVTKEWSTANTAKELKIECKRRSLLANGTPNRKAQLLARIEEAIQTEKGQLSEDERHRATKRIHNRGATKLLKEMMATPLADDTFTFFLTVRSDDDFVFAGAHTVFLGNESTAPAHFAITNTVQPWIQDIHELDEEDRESILSEDLTATMSVRRHSDGAMTGIWTDIHHGFHDDGNALMFGDAGTSNEGGAEGLSLPYLSNCHYSGCMNENSHRLELFFDTVLIPYRNVDDPTGEAWPPPSATVTPSEWSIFSCAGGDDNMRNNYAGSSHCAQSNVPDPFTQGELSSHLDLCGEWQLSGN